MPSRFHSRGSIQQVLAWIAIAIYAGAVFGVVLYRRGAEDYSFILFMSVIAVVAIAIVAPRKFRNWGTFLGDPSDEPGYWSGSEPDEERLPEAKSSPRKRDDAA
jgi:hypothetical protein